MCEVLSIFEIFCIIDFNFCFGIRKGDNFFLIKFWIVDCKLFKLFFNIFVLFICWIKRDDILVMVCFIWINLVLIVVVMLLIILVFNWIFLSKLVVWLLIMDMKEDRCVLYCCIVSVNLVVRVLRVLICWVNNWIFFIVVVLNRFFDRELIKGKNVFGDFFEDFVGKLVWGIKDLIVFIIFLIWFWVLICRVWKILIKLFYL